MERLTKRYDTHIAVVCENCDKRLACNGGMICGEVLRDRLAAYEDTGLEPEDIEALRDREQGLDELLVNISCGCSVPYIRLSELAQAEKDGQLVVLPYKVGDVVWTNFAMCGWHFRDKDRLYSAKVVFIGLNNSDEMGRGLINIAYEKHNYMMQFSFSDIGKSVFLTREEAEAAMKKRGEVDDEP